MYLHRTKRFLSILLTAILLTAAAAPSAFAAVPAKVSIGTARAYKSASVKSASIRLPKNLKVSITAVSGSWARIDYKGRTAYMPTKYLSPTKKVAGYAKAATPVYNSSGKKKGSLSKGTGVYVVGTVGKYYCIANKSGSIGYVKNGTLSSSKPAVTTLSKVDKALTLACSLVGKKYALYDNPPDSFNCSSFVQYCLAKAGYSIKNTAATQAADTRYKLITTISALKKGDVLCFDTSGDGKVDHSAIYLGDNRFIEASRNAGKVQTNTLTVWYKSHFVCARRPA